MAAGVILLLSLQIGINYGGQDHASTHIFEDYGKRVLDSMPKDSLFLMKGDNLVNTIANMIANAVPYVTFLFLMKGDNLVNTIAYLQESEHYRKAITGTLILTLTLTPTLTLI